MTPRTIRRLPCTMHPDFRMGLHLLALILRFFGVFRYTRLVLERNRASRPSAVFSFPYFDEFAVRSTTTAVGREKQTRSRNRYQQGYLAAPTEAGLALVVLPTQVISDIRRLSSLFVSSYACMRLSELVLPRKCSLLFYNVVFENGNRSTPRPNQGSSLALCNIETPFLPPCMISACPELSPECLTAHPRLRP